MSYNARNNETKTEMTLRGDQRQGKGGWRKTDDPKDSSRHSAFDRREDYIVFGVAKSFSSQP
jgi:hypothetical protein